MRPPRVLPFVIALVAVGCATTRTTTAERTFQKRRYQPGWHIDLGNRKDHAPKAHGTTVHHLAVRTSPIPTFSPERAPLPAMPSASPLIDEGTITATAGSIPVHDMVRPVAPASVELEGRASKVHVVEPDARWNPWAGPALVLALGTVAYGLVGTSIWVVLVGVVGTLVLASIAVRKGRTFEWRGKGMALAALVIGALAALATLVVLLSS